MSQPHRHNNHHAPRRPASMQQQAAATTARKRRHHLRGLLILVLSVLTLGLISFVVVQAFSPTPSPASVSVSIPAVSSALPPQPVSSVAAPLPSALPAASGPLDVDGIPPLYNRFNAIPDAHRAALILVSVGGGQQMEATAAAAFTAMQQAAAKDSVTLSPVSGYRTLERQTNNYNNSIQQYISSGHSQEEATRLTEQYYAIPGTSEHEMGLAMDIGQVNDSFATTAAFAWLQQHCTEYGFIYRYPKEFVDVTHINWEPWHYRFVGQNHAAEYTRLGMNTLEDYTLHLQGGAAGANGQSA